MQDDFERAFHEASRQVNALLALVTERRRVDLLMCQEAITSIVRCAFLVQRPLHEACHGLWGDITPQGAWVETLTVLKRELVEPFLCLMWCEDPFLQRSALVLLRCLFESDVLIWMEYWVMCVGHIFETRDVGVMCFGLEECATGFFHTLKKKLNHKTHSRLLGDDTHLSWLTNPQTQQKNSASPFATASTLVNILTRIAQGLEMHLFGAHLQPSDLNGLAYYRLCPRATSIESAKKNVEIFNKCFYLLHQSIGLFSCLTTTRMDSLFSSLATRYTVIFLEASFFVVLPQSLPLYITLLEMIPEWFVHRHAFPEPCLQWMMALVALMCYSVSRATDTEWPSPCVSSNPLALCTGVAHWTKEWMAARSAAHKGFPTEHSPLVFPPWTCDASWKGTLRVVMGVQILKIFALARVKGNIVLEDWLMQCCILATCSTVEPPPYTLSHLYEAAERLATRGLLTTSLVSKEKKLRKKTRGEAGPQVSDNGLVHAKNPLHPGCVLDWCKTPKIDALSWLSCVHTPDQLVDLIMATFGHRSPSPGHLSLSFQASYSTETDPTCAEALNRQGLVVTSPLSDTSAPSTDDQCLSKALSLPLQEVDEQSSPQLLKKLGTHDSLQSLFLPHPATPMVFPTSLTYLQNHHHVLRAVHFQSLLDTTLSPVSSPPPPQASHGVLQAASFHHIKMELLQRLILHTSSDKDLQTRMTVFYFEKVWEPYHGDPHTSSHAHNAIQVSMDFLYTSYTQALRRYTQQGTNPSEAALTLVTFLEDPHPSLSLDPVFGFPLPFQPLQPHHTPDRLHDQDSLLKKHNRPESPAPDVAQDSLSYAAFHFLLTQFVLGVSRDTISLQHTLDDLAQFDQQASSHRLHHWISFLQKSPYIPQQAFSLLWHAVLTRPHTLDTILPFLYTLFRVAPTASPIHRHVAYQMLLRFSCHAQSVVRQKTLALINSKLLHDAPDLQHDEQKQTLTPQDHASMDPSSLWMISATGSWLHFIADALLGKALGILLSWSSGPSSSKPPQSFPLTYPHHLGHYSNSLHTFIHQAFEDHTRTHTSLDPLLPLSNHASAFPLHTSSLPQMKLWIQRYATLLSVLSSHRPELLEIFFHFYRLVLPLSRLVSQVLYEHYVDTLHWIPKTKFHRLIKLCHDLDPQLLPLKADILCLLVDALTQDVSCSVTRDDVLQQGLHLYQTTNALHMALPLLPCLPQNQSEDLFNQCLRSSDSFLIRRAITRVLTYHTQQDSYPKATSFISPDRVLFLLGQYAQDLPAHQEHGLSYVFDALDHCIDLADTPHPKIPPHIFLNFLGHSVDEFWHANATKRLPRIFSHLVYRITVKLPSLRSAILSDLLTLLFKNNTPGHYLWSDTDAWQGLCATVQYIWNLPVQTPDQERENTKTRKDLLRLLAQIPREVLNPLLKHTQIPFHPTKNQ